MDDLNRELMALRHEKAALETQTKLIETFVAMARHASEGQLLKATLQKTLEVCIELTGAEKGSIFLFDEQGAVSDSILTRKETTPGQTSLLIGQVMDDGLAGWVKRNRRIGLIEDTLADERWLTLPDQPYQVRSALAVPIIRGRLLGLLTLLHSAPGHFKADAIGLMQATSEQIGLALENIGLYARLEDSYHSLEKARREAEAYSRALDLEMEKGRKIQLDFLPEHLPEVPGWDIQSSFHPTWQVSGDFYDVFLLADGRLGLVIADVSDKGIGAALFMALFRSLIRAFSRETVWGDKKETPAPPWEDDDPGPLRAVEMTNDYIIQYHSDTGMFATLFFGLLDLSTGRLSYVNAGHEPLFIIGPGGLKTQLERNGPAVGLVPGMRYTVNQARVDSGDMLLGYTDGVTEARSPEDEMFGRDRLLKIIESGAPQGRHLFRRIEEKLKQYIGSARQSDDITMIAARRL